MQLRISPTRGEASIRRAPYGATFRIGQSGFGVPPSGGQAIASAVVYEESYVPGTAGALPAKAGTPYKYLHPASLVFDQKSKIKSCERNGATTPTGLCPRPDHDGEHLPRNSQFSILNPQSPAFTLIELLVVIGIIAILASILLPVLAKGSLVAKKKAAKVEMKLLESAIISYEANYSHFPAKATGASDLTFGYANGITGVPVNSEVMIILMDIPTGVNANHVMNRSGLTPYAPRRVSDTNSPGFSIVDNQLRDLWGHPYVITMDLDGDRRCRDAFYSTSVSQIQPGQKQGYNGLMDYGTGFFELDAPVMIWSLGPDGKYDDSPTAKANAGANQDNIPSWQ